MAYNVGASHVKTIVWNEPPVPCLQSLPLFLLFIHPTKNIVVVE